MGKAVAAMVMSFIAGGAGMGLLAGVLGVHAEAAALGIVGAGLVGSSMVLGKLAAGTSSTTVPGHTAQARQ